MFGSHGWLHYIHKCLLQTSKLIFFIVCQKKNWDYLMCTLSASLLITSSRSGNRIWVFACSLCLRNISLFRRVNHHAHTFQKHFGGKIPYAEGFFPLEYMCIYSAAWFSNIGTTHGFGKFGPCLNHRGTLAISMMKLPGKTDLFFHYQEQLEIPERFLRTFQSKKCRYGLNTQFLLKLS